MKRAAFTMALSIAAVLIAAVPATSRTAARNAAPKPCSTSKVGSATVLNWCGPAKATVKHAGKTLVFKGGVCAISKGFGGKPTWSLNIGKFTNPPAKPKFTYFGALGTKWKPGTYTNLEFLLSFQTPGKAYTIGGPLKVTIITAGGKKGTFSGRAFLSALGKGTPVSGSWSC